MSDGSTGESTLKIDIMKKTSAIAGWVVITGTVGFIFIVALLHFVQPGYDPLQQQISELALGQYGFLMLPAFFSYAAAAFAYGCALLQLQAPFPVSGLLFSSACCLLGGGLFRLDNAANTHIALVSIAFILLVLAMVLLPMKVCPFRGPLQKAFCWSLSVGTAAFIAAGQNLMPLGLGQRGAVLCISAWLIWSGRLLIRRGDQQA